LLKAGDQDPEIKFVEIVGRAFSADPAQIAETELKVGVEFGLTINIPLLFVDPFQNPPPVEL
jgi:hypothetical protein